MVGANPWGGGNMKRNFVGRTSASLLVIASYLSAGHAHAAAAPLPVAAKPSTADDNTLGEIVVTARRQSENLQNVPVSVQVVTGEAIQKLAITRGEELSKLAPGLNLNSPVTSDGAVILRGVRWSSGSGQAAIPFYLNDADFGSTITLLSLYDLGQVEVLRGPQGTTRGAPSISGAVTMTTHTPDLAEYGGYAQGLVGQGDHWSTQGAVNIPLVKDKLAIRLAGVLEDTEGNRIKSVNNPSMPDIKTTSYRASVHAKPVDTFEVNAMYERLSLKGGYFPQVEGPGSAGLPARGVPANFNGPAISVKDSLGVQELPSTFDQNYNLWTVNATWDVFGQRLSYNFGASDFYSTGSGSLDPGNVLPGFDGRPSERTAGFSRMHEIRLSSERGDHLFDYDLGYFHEKTAGPPVSLSEPVFFSGAFGPPGTATPGAVTSPVGRYTLQVNSQFSIQSANESFYGNLQAHLPHNTELSGGVRRISVNQPVSLTINTGSSFFPALQNPLAGILTCEQLAALSPAAAGLVTSPVYPKFCDFPIAASTSTTPFAGKHHHTIWNASLSHRFNDAILAYATAGTSFRVGYPAIGNDGLPPSLVNPDPEKARSYELGIKTNVGRRLRFNADIFQIDYIGQLTSFKGIQYFNSIKKSVDTTGEAFFRNVDARVRGIESEISASPIDNLTLAVDLSYSVIESRGGEVPCNDPARPLSASNPINTCPSIAGANINASAPFQASVNGAYTLPVGEYDGYLRFNLNFQGRSPNFGTSETSTPSYALVDLFAGLTGDHSDWDVGLYAKNIFDKKAVLTSVPMTNSVYAEFGSPGYNAVATTAPREVGIQARYAWGAR